MFNDELEFFLSLGWPRLPRDITVTGHTGTSATISWLIPYIESSPELYTVVYGTASDSLVSQTAISSGLDTSIVDQVYSRTILGLEYVTMYYFRITVTNDIGTASTEILSFTTAEGCKFNYTSYAAFQSHFSLL